MTITIQLHYRTSWGESVQLRLGKRRIPMEPSFGGLWQIILSGKDIHDGDHFTFEIVSESKVIKREWREHNFQYHTPGKNIIVRSRWMDRPANSAFYSSAFSDVIFRRPDGASFRHPHAEEGARGTVSMQVAAPAEKPRVPGHHRLRRQTGQLGPHPYDVRPYRPLVVYHYGNHRAH